jgi:leucine-rich repeat protein SHOC2
MRARFVCGVSLLFVLILIAFAITPCSRTHVTNAHAKPGMSNVVVFHDPSYQHAGTVKPPFDTFSTKLAENTWELPIVRNPGPVRDCTVPFCTELQTNKIGEGRAVFSPLAQEGLTGRAVLLVDVDQGPLRLFTKSALSCAQSLLKTRRVHGFRLMTECAVQTAHYAKAILLELERIRRDWAYVDGGQLGSTRWEQHVAVLVPGVPEGLAAELLAATLATADARGFVAVAAALRRVSVSVVNAATMYFGAVENMAGLERAVVVVTGMEHPRYTMYRVEHERWKNSRSRVDSRVYLAITRCTAELAVVETDVGHFAAHFAISQAMLDGSDGVAPWVGSYAINGEPARVSVEQSDKGVYNTLRLTQVVDLENPPTPNALANAVSVRLRHQHDNWLDREKWASSSFRWSQCERGIRELDIARQLRPALAHLINVNYSPSGAAYSPSVRCVEEASLALLTDLGVCELVDLEVLWMHQNQLGALPREIGQLSKLNELHLGGNKLNTHGVPAEIGRLSNLALLTLDMNQLSSVPPAVWQLTNLTKLWLNNNRLTSVSAGIASLKSLTFLQLHQNMLKSLPPEIGELHTLRELHVGGNLLVCLPPEIGKLAKLRLMTFDYNLLQSVPPEIGQLHNLARLRLDNNKLTSLPAEIGQLGALTELSLNGNLLESLPEEIGQLSMLSILSVQNNKLTTLPSVIGQLGRLAQLRLNSNQLTQLPGEIGQLTELTALWLQDNQLEVLPPEIWTLRELMLLHLGQNRLTSLPGEVGQLKHLTSLGLRVDKLTSVPAEIGQLVKLVELGLGGEWLHPPVHCQQGRETM